MTKEKEKNIGIILTSIIAVLIVIIISVVVVILVRTLGTENKEEISSTIEYNTRTIMLEEENFIFK